MRGASGEWSSRQRWCESGDPRTPPSVLTGREAQEDACRWLPEETGLRDCFLVQRCGLRAALTNRNSPIGLSYDEIAIACGSIVETVERSSSCSQPRFPAAAKRFPVPVPDLVTLARAMPMKGLHESSSHALPEGRFLGFPDLFPVLRENRQASRPDCGRNMNRISELCVDRWSRVVAIVKAVGRNSAAYCAVAN